MVEVVVAGVAGALALAPAPGCAACTDAMGECPEGLDCAPA